MFRPYSLTSLGAWTVGALAGNRAYYSTKEKQAIQGVADTLTDEYLKYREYGGELEVIAWMEEKKHNMQLTPEEVAVRTIILEFQGRKLPMRDMGYFVIAHLNIFLNVNHSQYKAFNKRPYDWLDDETLFQLWDAFFRQLYKEGLSKSDAINEAFVFLGLKIGEKRLKEFGNFFSQKRVSYTEQPDRTLAITPSSESAGGENPASTKTAESHARDGTARFGRDLYISRDSETLGPFTYSQLLALLEAGEISRDDLVAYDNGPSWLKVKNLIKKVNAGQLR